jgi:shikimate kinase
MPHPPTNHILVLIGLSGTGKSTVGWLLSARLGWPLLDTDTLVIQAAGRPVAQIFSEDGEARFRDLEAAALREAVAAAPCVIATGGGVVLREESRALLRERAYIIWLDAPTEELVARLLAHDEQRPLLAGDAPAARIEALRAARVGLYAALADVRVVTAGRTAEAICDEIMDAFTSRSGGDLSP